MNKLTKSFREQVLEDKTSLGMLAIIIGFVISWILL